MVYSIPVTSKFNLMSVQLINGIIFMDHDDFVTSSGNNNNIDIHSTCIIVSTTNNNDSLTGFIGETLISGQMLWIVNASATNSLVLKHNDSGSTSGLRILTSTGANVTLSPYQQAQLLYIDQVGREGWWLKQ